MIKLRTFSLRRFFLLLIFVSPLLRAQNGQILRITCYTGGDDLRGGQTVKAVVYAHDNRKDIRNVVLNGGSGSGNFSNFNVDIPLNGYQPSDFRAITLFFDGAPTQNFQSWDNWNLDRIRVIFLNPSANEQPVTLLNLTGQPLVRFSQENDAKGWALKASAPQNAGNNNRNTPMDDRQLSSIKMLVRSEANDPLATAIHLITRDKRPMTTAQTRSMMNEFKQDNERLRIAEVCYPNVTDRAQFPTLADAFMTNNMARTFENRFGRVANVSPPPATQSNEYNNSPPNQNSPLQRITLNKKINGKGVQVRYTPVAIKGRNVWSTISPFGKIWRTGSNEATTITFEQDVVMWRTTVRAGTYALFTIPGPKNWTVILNRNSAQWGASNYNEALDEIRLYEDIRPHAFTEQLTFEIIMDGIMLRWENLEVFIPVE